MIIVVKGAPVDPSAAKHQRIVETDQFILPLANSPNSKCEVDEHSHCKTYLEIDVRVVNSH